MSLSLYRKYRPQNFSSVVGQIAAIDVLTSSLAKNRPGHAYLFSGSRGCGKTSVARIFAKALNCLDPQGVEPCGKCSNCVAITAGKSLDVMEIDGASNNGVEEIRELKSNVTITPFSSKYKIYIIDEVHMLSQAAFNALLKTLEEPPERVIFIMATTEPHKVPVTIRSRCQHIPFHSIGAHDIFTRLKEICALENVQAEDSALWEISRQADGALRDALSLLEQVISSGNVTLSSVELAFGVGSRSSFEKWVISLRDNQEEAYIILKKMFDSGASPVRVFEEIFSLVRDLWLVSKWQNIAKSLGISEHDTKFLLDESPKWQNSELHRLLIVVLKLLRYARSGMRTDILLGMFQLGLVKTPAPVNNDGNNIKQNFTPRLITPEPVISRPQVIAPPIVPNEVTEETPLLREEIMNEIKSKNFKIYCALFDSRPINQDGNLILDMKHRYCYEILKIDRNAAFLSAFFNGYKSVTLRHGPLSQVCPKIKPKQETSQAKPVNKQDKRDKPEFKQEKQENIQEQAPEPVVNVPAKKSSSILERVRNYLSAHQLPAEIVLMSTNEDFDSDNDIDISSAESEGDNDE